MAIHEMEPTAAQNGDHLFDGDRSRENDKRPSNWRSQWEQVIEERRASRMLGNDERELKSLLKDLFG